MNYKKYITIIFEDVSTFGGLVFYVFLCILFLLMGKIDLTIKLLAGIILLYILVNISRILYFKERPQKQVYSNFIEKIDASSFPSMHASRVSFLSFVLVQEVKDIYLTILFVIMSILVFYSRIYLKKHYLIDIIGGITIGIIVWYFITLII